MKIVKRNFVVSIVIYVVIIFIDYAVLLKEMSKNSELGTFNYTSYLGIKVTETTTESELVSVFSVDNRLYVITACYFVIVILLSVLYEKVIKKNESN